MKKLFFINEKAWLKEINNVAKNVPKICIKLCDASILVAVFVFAPYDVKVRGLNSI